MHPFRTLLSDAANGAGVRLSAIQARLRRMQGRDLAIGLGGLLAGVAIAGLAIQAPKQKAAPADARIAAAPPSANAEPKSAPPEPAGAANSTIKIIGASAGSVPCDQQTWPYIERRCLTEAPPRQDEPVTQATAPEPPAPATAAAALPASDAKPIAARPEEKKPPDAKPIESKAAPAIAVARERATPDPEAPETTGAAVKAEPVSLPDEAKSDRAAERKKSWRRHEDRARREQRQEASQEASIDDGRPAAQTPRDRRSGKVVKRWRELVYDYPDGSRKRVIVDADRASARRMPMSDDD